MNKTKLENISNVSMFVIGMFAMLCLLIYSWNHTGSLLARHTNPYQLGYITAFGIETSVIWLSWKVSKTNKWRSKSGMALIMVVVVSMFANLSEGFITRYGMELTTLNASQINWIQFIISVMATLLISIIVFALAEVLSNDSKKVMKTYAQPDLSPTRLLEEAPQTMEKVTGKTPRIKVKRDKALVNKEEVFIKYIESNPTATYRDIVTQTNLVTSSSQVKPLAELAGYVKTNTGWMKVNE